MIPLLLASIAATILAAPSSAADPGPTFKVTGVVTSSRDGSPVPRCTVTLTPSRSDDGTRPAADRGLRAGGRFGRAGAGDDNASPTPGETGRRPVGIGRGTPQEQETAVTDAHGRFLITVPYAGSWVLSGAGRGYPAQRYEQHDKFSTALILSPRSPELRVDLILKPAASLNGFVLDETGDAVRSGQVVLQRKEPPPAAGAPVHWQSAGFAQTDDRGHYELTGLTDGEYRLAVTAHPWYATSTMGQMQVRGNAAPPSAAQADPSLDVVFPLTWYPGTTEERSANTLTIQAGENRQADLHLQAIQAIHLTVPRSEQPATAGNSGTEARPGRGEVPQLIRRGAEGLPFAAGFGQASSVQRDGTWDIGGLTPGTYEIRLPTGTARTGRLVQVTVAEGSSTTVSLDHATETLQLKIELEGAEPSDLAALLLTDVHNGEVYSNSRRGGGRFRGGAGRTVSSDDPETDGQSVQLPPGDYFVAESLVAGDSLSGLTATGAQITGRVIRLVDGAPVLTLHVQHGRTRVIGNALSGGKPDPGAMVLLVPASFGSPGNLTVIRRDQAASDGSFSFADVAPGPYLLVSLTNGWAVNWRDPATLAQSLAEAIPLSVPASGKIEQQLTSVQP